MRERRTLRRWELALLLGAAFAALAGVWLDGQQNALANQMIRLHVIANSDSEADQTLKLQVRDEVLAQAETLLAGESDLAGTEAALAANLRQLAEAGARAVGEAGYDYPVTVSLKDGVWFPTREYGDFALPAGNYTALQVVIGEGNGQNWWCVVFPPLCLGSVTEDAAETALSAGLDEEQVALITGENEGYVIRFKLVELWERLQNWIQGE